MDGCFSRLVLLLLMAAVVVDGFSRLVFVLSDSESLLRGIAVSFWGIGLMSFNDFFEVAFVA